MVAGIVVDYVGLRRTIVTGLLVIGSTGASGLFLNDATALIATRFIMGLASACLSVACTAFVITMFIGNDRTRALSWQGAATGMIGILAVFISGILTRWVGWRAPFALYPLAVTPAIISALAIVPRLQIARDPEPADSLPVGTVWSVLLMLIPLNALIVMSSAQLPFLLRGKGITGTIEQTGLIGVSQIAHIPGALLFPMLIRSVGSRNTMSICLMLLGAGLIGLSISKNTFSIFTESFMFALAVGILMPFVPYLIASRTTEGVRNRAIGWAVTATFIGVFANPLLIAAVQYFLSLEDTYCL